MNYLDDADPSDLDGEFEGGSDNGGNISSSSNEGYLSSSSDKTGTGFK